MDLYEAIDKRFAARAYQARPVEDAKLMRVLDAGRLSPSARNRQARKFVVVRSRPVREAIAKAADQPFLATAPVIVAVVGLTPDDKMSCQVPTDPVDCAIAIDHMSLAAVAEGLGSCWIGHFDQNAVRDILKVPPTAMVIELMPLGYPAEQPKTKQRKSIEEVVSYDTFS